jgi:hypothetical protein
LTSAIFLTGKGKRLSNAAKGGKYGKHHTEVSREIKRYGPIYSRLDVETYATIDTPLFILFRNSILFLRNSLTNIWKIFRKSAFAT